MKIPEAALQQHMAVLGKTGSGKTFAVKGIVEGWLAAKKRVGIVDPTGAWWGLRSSQDGKGAGFPILVLGGDHGDLPLPALGGAAVARLLTEQGVNLVADTLHLTVGERTRWFTDFANTLYRTNKAPLHLVLDEAHNFAPQGKVPDPDTGKMLHAANTLASGGRSRGIRVAMITQRPQKLHKDTLTCADTLIAMRVLAPHDRLAVEDWIKGCGDMATGKEVLNSLASLQRGEGWAWYPEGKFLQRMKFPSIKTFDSSATPTDGGIVKAPKGVAEIDLTEIKAAMADAVKEAEANDPKLLRLKIRELEKQLSSREVLEKIIEVPVLKNGQLDRTEKIAVLLQQHADKFLNETAELRRLIAPAAAPRPIQRHHTPAPAVIRAAPRQQQATDATGLGRAERMILVVLAQRSPQPSSRAQLAILSGYSMTSSGFSNALSALRTAGYLDGRGDDNRITQEGMAAVGNYEPLPTGQALVSYWLNKLGKAERSILDYTVRSYPKAVSKEEISADTGYSITSSGFSNALSKLRTLQLIAGRGEVKASDDLCA